MCGGRERKKKERDGNRGPHSISQSRDLLYRLPFKCRRMVLRTSFPHWSQNLHREMQKELLSVGPVALAVADPPAASPACSEQSG